MCPSASATWEVFPNIAKEALWVLANTHTHKKGNTYVSHCKQSSCSTALWPSSEIIEVEVHIEGLCEDIQIHRLKFRKNDMKQWQQWDIFRWSNEANIIVMPIKVTLTELVNFGRGSCGRFCSQAALKCSKSSSIIGRILAMAENLDQINCNSLHLEILLDKNPKSHWILAK